LNNEFRVEDFSIQNSTFRIQNFQSDDSEATSAAIALPSSQHIRWLSRTLVPLTTPLHGLYQILKDIILCRATDVNTWSLCDMKMLRCTQLSCRCQEVKMTTKVTEQGLLIPKSLLEDVEEVEIHKERNVIVITPLRRQDPVFELGTQPVTVEVNDASVNHDAYLDHS
jgi:virulence-associated protein VagC